MDSKDLFSDHSKLYAAFRPTYPESLYEFIFQFVKRKSIAWDCATGNGQVAQRLAKTFDTVYASDLSEKQLQQAVHAPNIIYSVGKAEQTPYENEMFDLITVAQALHWFNINDFYDEVRRVGKKGGVIAIWGYSYINTASEMDQHIYDFYNNVVGPFWDVARRLVEDEYRSVDFPFQEIQSPRFYISAQWTIEHLAGYLESWSSTQGFIKKHRHNPVPELIQELHALWGPKVYREVTFPVFMKLGYI